MNKLGKYEILEELGRGAMGVVYKARDPLINRMVAMKTITSGLAEQADMLERFYREAQAAGGLQHPNIVTIYDLGEENKTPYIAMELLDGISLEKVIEEQHPLPMSQKIGYIVQVCRALDYAHKRGVVHRDIKPANIQVKTDGTIKVMDFGIARLVDTSRSQTGLLIGTVNYMSPEQVRGERVDGRSDIFSVGVMFYELLSLQRPFSGANFTAVMLAIISQEHKAVSTLIEGVPPDLDQVFAKFLKKDVNDRYQMMEEALLDLEPLYRKMQTETVSGMVKQTHELMASKKMEEARDVLRQALLIDSTHREARTLLEKINSELKRSLVVPKVEEHVHKAKSLMGEGKIAEAQAEVETALKLDSVYEPAQELMKEIQKEADRAKKARDFLKAAQQQMAEGNLTEAQQQVNRLLEMDSKNAQAQKLLKQIEEEKERRTKRQRLLDTMQKARSLWTQQKYSECIPLLEGLKKEFPGEDEIEKLLETVRADQADQEKHERLSEARRLLGEQHFAESLSILDKVLERSPNETAVQKLRDLVVKERKEHATRVRLQHEQQALKKLVNEENFKDAISKGEQLIKEFPDDFELNRLVEYARTQHQQADQARKLKERMDEVQGLMNKGEFTQAAAAAQKALEAFPGNIEFRRLFDDADKKGKDKDKRDYVEKQIRSIKANIDKGNLTDAIDMGKQTLAVVKNNTDVTRLLQFAEREHEMREQRKSTDNQLKTAIFHMESKNFDEATKILEDVKKTVVFDPRVHSLLEAAKKKEVQPEKIKEIQGTIVGMSGVSREQEYVLQTPGGQPATRPADEPAGVKAQATPAVEPSKPAPAPPKAAPVPEKEKKAAPAVEPPKPPVEEKKKGKPKVEEPEPVKAKPAVEPPAPPKPAPPPPKPPEPVKAKPAVVEEKKAPAVPPPPPPRPAPAVAAPSIPAEEPKPFLKSPAGMAAIGALVVVLAVGGYFLTKGDGSTQKDDTAKVDTGGGGGTTGPTLEQQQRDIIKAANELADADKFQDAVTKVDEGLKLNGPLNGELQTLRVTLLKGSENAKVFAEERRFFDQGMSAFNAGRWNDAESAFKKVIALKGGRRQSEASNYVSVLIPNRKQEETAFADARKLAGSTNPADLTKAKGQLETVVKLNGPRKNEAQNLLSKVNSDIDKLGKDAAIQGFLTAGRQALNGNDYAAARSSADSMREAGGDPSGLLSEISQKETSQLNQFIGQFNQLKSGRDPSRLEALQGQVKRFADASGNSSAKDLADNQIPKAVQDMRAAIASDQATAAAQQARQEFDRVVGAFNGARDAASLRRVQGDFERIANSTSPHAAEARDYVTNKIPAKMVTFRPPCPAIVVPAAGGGGLTKTPQPGETVAASMLDEKPAWANCQLPEAAGTGPVRLSITINESGAVENVSARGAQPNQQLYEAVAAAAKNWKLTNPPKAKGIAVKTVISYDVSY